MTNKRSAGFELFLFSVYSTVAFLGSILIFGAFVGAYRILTEWLGLSLFQTVLAGSTLIAVPIILRYPRDREDAGKAQSK